MSRITTAITTSVGPFMGGHVIEASQDPDNHHRQCLKAYYLRATSRIKSVIETACATISGCANQDIH